MSENTRSIDNHMLNIELLYNALEYLGHETPLDILQDFYLGIKSIDDISPEINKKKIIELIDIQQTAIDDSNSVPDYDEDLKNDLKLKLMKKIFKDTTFLF